MIFANIFASLQRGGLTALTKSHLAARNMTRAAPKRYLHKQMFLVFFGVLFMQKMFHKQYSEQHRVRNGPQSPQERRMPTRFVSSEGYFTSLSAFMPVRQR